MAAPEEIMWRDKRVCDLSREELEVALVWTMQELGRTREHARDAYKLLRKEAA